MSFFGNPMVDFVSFVFTSVKPTVAIDNLCSLVEFYHTELSQSIGNLKVQSAAPSLDQLRVQMQRAGPVGE